MDKHMHILRAVLLLFVMTTTAKSAIAEDLHADPEPVLSKEDLDYINTLTPLQYTTKELYLDNGETIHDYFVEHNIPEDIKDKSNSK